MTTTQREPFRLVGIPPEVPYDSRGVPLSWNTLGTPSATYTPARGSARSWRRES